MYFGIESPASERIEPVWAIPDNPPKESSWMTKMYFSGASIIQADKRLMPLVISRFPMRIVSISGGCVAKLASMDIRIWLVTEKSTIYPHIFINISKLLRIPQSMMFIFRWKEVTSAVSSEHLNVRIK